MENSAIYCTNCGTANEAGTKFCYKCGTPIKNLPVETDNKTTSDFITLACPNCGGQLEITADTDRFACKFCGNEHLVRRSGGHTSLEPVVAGIKRVEQKFDHVLTGSDRMAAEQTIQRLKTEIVDLQKACEQKKNEFTALEKKYGKESKYSSLEPIDPYTKNKKRKLFGTLFLFPIPIALFILAGCSTSYQFFDILYELGWYDLALSAYSDRSFLVVFIILGIFSFFTGIVLLKIESAKKKKYQRNVRDIERKLLFQKMRDEINQAESQLLDHQKRLEDLHHYTTER